VAYRDRDDYQDSSLQSGCIGTFSGSAREEIHPLPRDYRQSSIHNPASADHLRFVHLDTTNDEVVRRDGRRQPKHSPNEQAEAIHNTAEKRMPNPRLSHYHDLFPSWFRWSAQAADPLGAEMALQNIVETGRQRQLLPCPRLPSLTTPAPIR